ncbi:MAG: PIG-L family deacetylase [Verrucomicrobiota bacterium]
MQFSQSNVDLLTQGGVDLKAALGMTTHLGIGAHHDDLEFMALHGIGECFERNDQWFGGITCTDGAGSSRSGKYADFSDKEMQTVRIQEQRQAAELGQYSFMAQLGHPSTHAKDPTQRPSLVQDLVALLSEIQPGVIYTHNPFDKHATHIGVMKAVLDAIALLPADQRPLRLLGCEVWRGLDWLNDESKVLLDVSTHAKLGNQLSRIFDSQIAGGKRYDLAVEGRQLANATFLGSHKVDHASQITYAVDLTPIVTQETSLENLVKRHLSDFEHAVQAHYK